MRLTAEILLRADQYLNPQKERELNLRGFKIPAIENLSVIQDQFDVIDFSDNEIKKLDNFPTMNRLNCLILNNNYISKVGNVGETLQGVKFLVLTNNKISNLSEIDNIATLKKLECISLLENPVSLLLHYRYYVIFRVPTLKCLDYVKVGRSERECALKFFESKVGKDYLMSIKHDDNQTNQGNKNLSAISYTEEQKMQIKFVIENARTKEEIDIIENQLKTGTFVFAPISGSINEPHSNQTLKEKA